MINATDPVPPGKKRQNSLLEATLAWVINII